MTITLQIATKEDPRTVIKTRVLAAGEGFVAAMTDLLNLPDPDCRILSMSIGTESMLSYEHAGTIWTFTCDAEARTAFCAALVRSICIYADLRAEVHGEDLMAVAHALRPSCDFFYDLLNHRVAEVAAAGTSS